MTLFDRPAGPALTLPSAPRLASWDAASHPAQQRLRAYLVETEAFLSPAMAAHGERLALELIVGLPDRSPLTHGGHDLDNYLMPMIHHLGSSRFDAVFGTKRHARISTVAVGPAVEVVHTRGARGLVHVRTTASAQSPAWKQQVHDACEAAVPYPMGDGPIAVTIRFGVSPRRNWTNLWKPAIDSLGPLLGTRNPARPFHPNDDRIVHLALHRGIDDDLGNDVTLDVWWRLASP